MEKRTLHLENTNILEETLEEIAARIPCFITREYIEMNYSKITFIARIEDIELIDTVLAPLYEKTFRKQLTNKE